jgi:hypothetical protein
LVVHLVSVAGGHFGSASPLQQEGQEKEKKNGVVERFDGLGWKSLQGIVDSSSRLSALCCDLERQDEENTDGCSFEV